MSVNVWHCGQTQSFYGCQQKCRVDPAMTHWRLHERNEPLPSPFLSIQCSVFSPTHPYHAFRKGTPAPPTLQQQVHIFWSHGKKHAWPLDYPPFLFLSWSNDARACGQSGRLHLSSPFLNRYRFRRSGVFRCFITTSVCVVHEQNVGGPHFTGVRSYIFRYRI